MKVVFIGGSPRSGSTLLNQLLGRVPGFLSVGELVWIWKNGYVQNELCGCGARFSECTFWQTVMNEMRYLLTQEQLSQIGMLEKSIMRWRYFPYMMLPIKPRHFRKSFGAYREIISKLYSAIQKVSGKHNIIIVDSSKEPYWGYLLSTIPNIELYIIHLIRDSRAVGYSMQRRKRKPEIYWKEEYMPQTKPFLSSVNWCMYNLGMELLRFLGLSYKLLRYEDLVAHPHTIIRSLLTWLREPLSISNLPDEHNPVFINHTHVIHSISGNPIRFHQGIPEMRLDAEWQERMSNRDKWLVNILTWPFLLYYGYLRVNKWQPLNQKLSK